MRKSLLVLLLGLTVVGCGGNDDSETATTTSASSTSAAEQETVTVTEADKGQERRILAGQRLVVRLPSNPSTGYGWRLADIDRAVLRQEGEPDYQPDPTREPAPGSGGTAVWDFVGNAAGVTVLKLEYARPWEHGMEPAEVFTLTVKVE